MSDDDRPSYVRNWEVGSTNTAREQYVSVGGRTLKLTQQPGAGLVGASLWDSAVLLCRYLSLPDAEPLLDRIRGRRLIELGCGCGLLGMALSLHGATLVTLTDKADVLPHTRANLAANGFGENDGRLTVLPYQWGTKAEELSPPYDAIVATDVVYLEAQIGPFIASLHALAGPSTTIVLAIERRDPAVMSAFLAALKAGFKVKAAPARTLRRLVPEDEAAAEYIALLIAHPRKRAAQCSPQLDDAQVASAACEPNSALGAP